MLNFFLKTAAKLLVDSNASIVQLVLDYIAHADRTLAKGGEKFQWVRAQVVPLLTGKAGWVVDTVIQLLVAWTKRRAA